MNAIAQIGRLRTLGHEGPPSLPGIREFGDGDDDIQRRLRRYRLGLALFVASVGMLFVGFSSAYIVRRGIPTYDVASGAYSLAWEPLELPIEVLFANTFLLVAASLTAEVARRAARAASHSNPGKDFKRISGWMYVSAALAVSFVAGQVFAWHVLLADGHHLSSGARTAFFYVLTGTHAFHAFLGVMLMAGVAFRARLWSAALRHISTDLAAWYLHSMAVFWIYLFCFLVLA